MPSAKVTAVAIDPYTPQKVYLAGPDGLFRSADGGLTWKTMKVDVKAAPLALTLNSRTPAMLFVLLADGTLLRSENSGDTWTTVEAGR